MPVWAGQQARKAIEGILPNPKLKLLDQVREVLRLKHYSIRTESCYCDWIRRYIRFHKMQTRGELNAGEAKIELFLSDLAVNGHVAASTQNQAFNALLFLYREVLHQDLQGIQAVDADAGAEEFQPPDDGGLGALVFDSDSLGAEHLDAVQAEYRQQRRVRQWFVRIELADQGKHAGGDVDLGFFGLCSKARE